MLEFARNGLKNIEKFPNLTLPVQMSELSFALMDSGESIDMDEINTILENWSGFQLETATFVKIGNKRFPSRF